MGRARLSGWGPVSVGGGGGASPIRLLESLSLEFLLSCSALTDFHWSFIRKYSSLPPDTGVKTHSIY